MGRHLAFSAAAFVVLPATLVAVATGIAPLPGSGFCDTGIECVEARLGAGGTVEAAATQWFVDCVPNGDVEWRWDAAVLASAGEAEGHYGRAFRCIASGTTTLTLWGRHASLPGTEGADSVRVSCSVPAGPENPEEPEEPEEPVPAPAIPLPWLVAGVVLVAVSTARRHRCSRRLW